MKEKGEHIKTKETRKEEKVRDSRDTEKEGREKWTHNR
jgi:hypothetical protein